ncbi:MAG: PucR family transcriptional regulator [Firmicutes bacterium]|nr:PucR family transcriptional regulator [Bacillota bacterium]
MPRQNGITIDDIMKMDFMEKCKVIAGFKGVKNVVSKVNIMADPDILNWVDEGELLLTTAYSFKKDNIEEQKKLIKECSKKKLAGIGIKIYPYLESLSQEVLDLADRLNFPIIDLYYAIPFSDIMTPILKEIFNKQARLLQRVEHVHEELMNAMLSNSSLKKIAEVISHNIKNPILIKLQSPNESIEEFDFIDKDIKKILLENSRTFYDPELRKRIEKKLHESKVLINGKYIQRMVMPIVVKNKVFGHIFAWGINTPLGGFDYSVVETASTTIALEIFKELSIKEVENRYRSEFLEDLFSLDKSRKEKAIQRSHLFNLGIDDEYVIIVSEFNNKISQEPENEKYMELTQQSAQSILNLIEDLLNELGLVGIAASRTDSVQVLISFKNDAKTKKKLTQFKMKMEALLLDKFKNIDFRMGIGRPSKGLENVNKSLMDGVRAIRAGRILNKGRVVSFENLGIYKILCQDKLEDELKKFYDTTLKSLVEYDRKKSTELVKTLEAYFYSNGNLKRMSDILFTHYNTVLYRVQRINEITGMSLENPDDRLNLEIALKIKNLLKKHIEDN